MIKLKTTSKILLFMLAILVVLYIVVAIFGAVSNKNILVSEADDILNINAQGIADASNYVNTDLVSDISADDNIWGDMNAPIQMIVYEDLSNTYSAEFSKVIDKVEQEYAGKVVIAFRHYALKSFSLSIPSSLAVECANDQGRFTDMRDILISKTESNELNEEDFSSYAKDLSLNIDEFNTCLQNKKYLGKVTKQTESANGFDVFGTPTIFINKELVVGARPWDDFTTQDEEKVEGIKTIINRHI